MTRNDISASVWGQVWSQTRSAIRCSTMDPVEQAVWGFSRASLSIEVMAIDVQIREVLEMIRTPAANTTAYLCNEAIRQSNHLSIRESALIWDAIQAQHRMMVMGEIIAAIGRGRRPT